MQAAHVLALQWDFMVYLVTFAGFFCQAFGIFVDSQNSGRIRPSWRRSGDVLLPPASLYNKSCLMRSAPRFATLSGRFDDFGLLAIGFIKLSSTFAETPTIFAVKPAFAICLIVGKTVRAASFVIGLVMRQTCRAFLRCGRVIALLLCEAAAFIAGFVRALTQFTFLSLPASHRKVRARLAFLAGFADVFHTSLSYFPTSRRVLLEYRTCESYTMET